MSIIRGIKFIVMTAALLLLPSCAASDVQDIQSVQEEKAQTLSTAAFDQTYSIMLNIQSYDAMNAQRWVVDAEGNTIDREDEFMVLYDTITGEPQCKVRTRTVPTGERYEFGGPVTKDMRALYDMEGNLLYDWAAVDYGAGWGDFILRRDSAAWREYMYADSPEENLELSSLWNFVTGEAYIQGAAYAEPFDSGRVLLSNNIHSPLGVLDSNGEVYSGFPVEQELTYAEPWKDYIIAHTINPDKNAVSYLLLNDQFEPLLERDAIAPIYGAVSGDLLRYTEGEEHGIMTADGTVKMLLQEEESIYYADEEVLVIAEFNTAGNAESCRLADIHGNILAEGFSELKSALPYMIEKPTEQFIGIRDGKIELIDRTGAVIASIEAPKAEYVEAIAEGVYIYSEEIDKRYVEALLGPTLETIIPTSERMTFFCPHLYDDQEQRHVLLDVVQATKTLNNVTTAALLDLQGNVLVDGLNNIYQVGPNRIACRKGFEAGLMDWEGSWIVKRSLFSALVDD